MHRITRTLTTGNTASRDVATYAEAESVFNGVLLRPEVVRATWHEGSEWDGRAKTGGWKLVRWGNVW